MQRSVCVFLICAALVAEESLATTARVQAEAILQSELSAVDFIITHQKLSEYFTIHYGVNHPFTGYLDYYELLINHSITTARAWHDKRNADHLASGIQANAQLTRITRAAQRIVDGPPSAEDFTKTLADFLKATSNTPSPQDLHSQERKEVIQEQLFLLCGGLMVIGAVTYFLHSQLSEERQKLQAKLEEIKNPRFKQEEGEAGFSMLNKQLTTLSSMEKKKRAKILKPPKHK